MHSETGGGRGTVAKRLNENWGKQFIGGTCENATYQTRVSPITDTYVRVRCLYDRPKKPKTKPPVILRCVRACTRNCIHRAGTRHRTTDTEPCRPGAQQNQRPLPRTHLGCGPVCHGPAAVLLVADDLARRTGGRTLCCCGARRCC